MSKLINFTEASSIAIHGMLFVLKSDKRVSILDIAEGIGASKHHVAKIMQQLVQDKFLKSSRGPGGGFILAKKTEEITLYDIYSCIEGEVEVDTCPAHNHFCVPGKCAIGTVGHDMLIEFVDKMKSSKLSDYL